MVQASWICMSVLSVFFYSIAISIAILQDAHKHVCYGHWFTQCGAEWQNTLTPQAIFFHVSYKISVVADTVVASMFVTTEMVPVAVVVGGGGVAVVIVIVVTR